MYIFRSDNRLEVPITLHLFKGMAEKVALVDSGTTKNFIDQETVKKLKLGSKKLSEPVWLKNIDGTYNQSGCVMHYIDLLVSQKTRKIMQQFYIINLGSDRIILGYLWLRTFNSEINWPNCKLIGPEVKLETILYARNPCHWEMLAKKWGVLNSTIPV
jgi:Retroviral aspartyl protease